MLLLTAKYSTENPRSHVIPLEASIALDLQSYREHIETFFQNDKHEGGGDLHYEQLARNFMATVAIMLIPISSASSSKSKLSACRDGRGPTPRRNIAPEYFCR